MFDKLFTPMITVFEGEGDGSTSEATAEAKAAEAKAAEEEANKNKRFSQEDMNKILADDRRKHQARTQEAIDEMKAIKARSDTSDSERSELETRIETLQSSIRTKEEQQTRDAEKNKKMHTEALDTMTKDRDTWQIRYTGATITRSITDAATMKEHVAYTPSQIVAILEPITSLQPVLDEDGKETGKLAPVVKMDGKDKEGNPITLDLTPTEAVKRLFEDENYFNLFMDTGEGGTGLRHRSSPKTDVSDIQDLAKNDPEKYRKLRQEGKISLK